MKRSTLFTASLLALAALAAGTAVAQTTDNGARSQRTTLDTNKDGVIDRNEAAASPKFAAMFDKLDKNGDGRLTQDERPQRKHGRGGRGHHGGIAKLDADGDGRISKAEAGGKGKLAENFAAIDANRDGYITRVELNGWHEKQRPIREAEFKKRFDERFATADLNKDGKLSKVEVGEKMPRFGKSFAWMDDNRDGFLSRSELQAGGHRGR